MTAAASAAPTRPATRARSRHVPLLLYGALLFCAGTAMYLAGVLMSFPRVFLGLNDELFGLNQWIVWYSGVPITLGIVLSAIDLLWLFNHKRFGTPLRLDFPERPAITVALTAYNDEESIAEAVADFRAHPLVKRVIVVSNNSSDGTFDRAREAGAIVLNETAPGYGRCVHRCLTEAAGYEDTDFVVLCEGDRTFRAFDIAKLLAYVPHADIVNGTRTVETLREHQTQLTTFLYYGNVFVGKLLEAKHLGRGTVTDVGTTYKLIRRNALAELLPLVNPAINLEFNAHLLDTALAYGFTLVECPVTFHPRVGKSKGGNASDWRGLMVGLGMIRGITFGWKAE